MSWALVTGSAKGLGAEICRLLAQKGHHVVIHYRNSVDAAQEVVKECRSYGVKAESVKGDFSTLNGARAFLADYLAAFPDTSVLVNNVGEYQTSSLSPMKIEEWESLFKTNFFAPALLTQGLIESLKAHKGSIVNIGVVGLERIQQHLDATGYRLSKLSLLGFTRALAKEMAPHQVRVNMVSPGHLENSIDLPAISTLPMGRAATLSEAAQAVYFFIDPENRYITGQNLEVAGGFAF